MNKQIWKCMIALAALSVLAGLLYPAATALGGPTALTFEDVTEDAGITYEGSTWSWAWGDYNDDGWIDLFLTNHPELSLEGSTSPVANFMKNNGDGTFTDFLLTTSINPEDDRHDTTFVDYDNDGDLDLWIAVGGRGGSGADGPNELYKQNRSGALITWSNVSAVAGVDYPKGRGRGTAWLDYDLDGDLDLFFTGAQIQEKDMGGNPITSGWNTMFRNEGDGTFTNVGAELGFPDNRDSYVGPQSNVSVVDYDKDGYPDMFVTGTTSSKLYHNEAGAAFTEVDQAVSGINCGSAQGADWGDYDNDGDMDLFCARGSLDLGGDYMRLDQVDGKEAILFVAGAGASDSDGDGEPDTWDEDGIDFSVPTGTAYTLTFKMHEQPGRYPNQDADLFHIGPDAHHPTMANDPDELGWDYFNLSSSEPTGPVPYTNGEDFGFFIWQEPAGEWHVRWSGNGFGVSDTFSGVITVSTSFSGDPLKVSWEEQTEGNLPDRLYKNQGAGATPIFTEVASASGITSALTQGDTRGVDWVDYDNDGDLDLYMNIGGTKEANGTNRMFRNNGLGSFEEVAASLGVQGRTTGWGWGAAFADYNNDGFMDLLINDNGWPWPFEPGGYQLLKNSGNGNHWIKIELRGDQSNSRGWGAKIEVTSDGKYQYRDTNDSSHYYIHYTGPFHFGLGADDVVDEIKVTWPSGVVDTVTNVAADRLVTIYEGIGLEEPSETETPVVTETQETPVVTETQETPVVTETQETPVVTETQETPVVTETQETPVVTETPEPPQPKEWRLYIPVVYQIPEQDGD